MAHIITVACSEPGHTWRVSVDGEQVLAFAGPQAEALAEKSRRDLESFLETDVSNLHDTDARGRSAERPRE